MDLIIKGAPQETTGWAEIGSRRFRCALGRSGIFTDKEEGDGATPAGRFALRRLLYRADRLAGGTLPETALPQQALQPQDGWCDDPADEAYNRAVTLPYAARHEIMWRADHIYDLVLVIGHNDDPVVAGAGSAVFVHLAHADYRPTEGCIAFARTDLATILASLGPDDHIAIELV
ncbi:MAG: L,D-transpeptidase family protein [Dongiaceae bacterium]